jgi:RND family efflux transporter MFP subunit
MLEREGWIRNNRRVTMAALGAIALIAAALSAAIYSHRSHASVMKGGSAAAASRPALTVTTTPAQRQALPSLIEASGVVAAWQEANVDARVSGLALISVDANVGDAIHKGQVLARFDDADVRAQVAQSEANLAQLEASARQADAERDRALALESRQVLSKQDLLQSLTRSQMAAAQVAQAKAGLMAARLKLDYTAVTAPDDGVVSSRSAALGQVATAGTELFRFIRRGRLEWRAEINSAAISAVTPGLEVSVRLPDGLNATGHVRQLAPSLSNDTRLALVYVDLDHAASARAGMYVNGTIQTSVRDATVVPAESIVIRDGRTYVLRLSGEQVQQRAVAIGRRQGSLAEILSGISPGDVVVVRGAGFLNDNDVVRVENGP